MAEESDWNLVDMDGELMTSPKRKISLENEAESFKIFVEEKLRANEKGSHKNSPLEIRTENNEAISIFEHNPVEVNESSYEHRPDVEVRNESSSDQNSVVQVNAESNEANSGQIPESLSAMSENPAIDILKLVRHGMRLEAMPKLIENFIESLTKYKNTLTVQSDHQFEKVLNTANELDSEINEKLYHLRNNIIKRGYAWLKSKRPKSFNPLNFFITDAVQKEENYQRSLIQQQSTPSNFSRDDFVLPNGRSPTLFRLTKNISHDLDQLIGNFTQTMKCSDKLDRAIFGFIGLRLYTNEFLDLCEFCKNGDPNNEEFEGLPVSLQSHHRQNIPVMIRDSNIVEKLKKLSSILDHDFYKKIAFSFVNQIFLKYPQDYSNTYEETYLESLQKACHLLDIIMESDNNGIYSTDIKKGIIEMERIIYKMDFISGSSSSD